MKILSKLRNYALAIFLAALPCSVFALGQQELISFQETQGSFPVAAKGQAATLLLDANELPGVVRAARDLQADIQRVTGITAALSTGSSPMPKTAIIIGSIGKSSLIDSLVKSRKLDLSGITGRWEACQIEVVEQPMPGVERALVIAGSDKRGCIYGIYQVSEQMGVSPWYWWADVPVTHRDAVFAKTSRIIEPGPLVRYRGIFLNDEAPALTGWSKEKFGGYNSKFYAKVFELILRLRGNYLWPAMWDAAFNEDDPENARLADEYGIVMGTSHHEPMLRAQQEWKRHGQGPWDYARNEAVLKQFWTDGMARNRAFESITTLGMRGDGDEPMSESENVALLERIVADQRTIITNTVSKDLSSVPQVWALYKEVQGYYERGMRVPDDVTLLWCDDNWGNIRRLPAPDERKRSGGAGVYYHFDYVGGPRNYKWLNTNPIPKIWEQMHLAWEYEARRIWIVNVGDLKPMELPIEYFLTLAWNPPAWPESRLAEFTRLWTAREFGAAASADIADLIERTTRYHGRRKPELLSPEVYSLINYGEAERVEAEWYKLQADAQRIGAQLPASAQDAYYQLVFHPIKAGRIVNDLYTAAARNRLYAAQGRSSTNRQAAKTFEFFKADADLTREFNKTLAGGKWSHMMDQTHLGYTYWQQPPRNAMPAVQELQIPEGTEIGVSIEGSPLYWPEHFEAPTLPALNAWTQQSRWIDIFNRSKSRANYSIRTSEPWLKTSQTEGVLESDLRLWVSADWAQVPKGKSKAKVIISSPGSRTITVTVPVNNPTEVPPSGSAAFIETDGCLAIEAEHYSSAKGSKELSWITIPGYGRTLSAVTASPATAPSIEHPAPGTPCLEYSIFTYSKGAAKVELQLSPTLAFQPDRGFRYAVSIDNDTPQVVDLASGFTNQDWEKSVIESTRRSVTKHSIATPGLHTLRIWHVDPGIVLQRIVIDLGGLKPSSFGPPESPR